jgi:cytochrome c-type biogenesis protein CcmH
MSSSWADDSDPFAARMRTLGQELRCLVCQNQTIADSQSGLAEDLRREIHVQMEKGETDQQIIDYLVARYGDFVRYNPPVKAITLLLWFGPGLAMVLGLLFLVRALRRRAHEQADAPLNSDERAALTALLADEARGEKT